MEITIILYNFTIIRILRLECLKHLEVNAKTEGVGVGLDNEEMHEVDTRIY